MNTTTATSSKAPDDDSGSRAAAFPDVLARELELVELRRKAALADVASAAVQGAAPGAQPPGSASKDFSAAQRTSTFGMTFSGGGIRSATFNLGVLQGIAEIDLLKHVDYLSTVSGGGYIGSWLHGVIRRTGDAPLRTGGQQAQLTDAQKKEAAREQIAHATKTLLKGVDSEPGPPDEDPISFLRKYSNYLAPQPGLFTADTWTIGFVWIRNVLLNQLILMPSIAAAVIATLLLTFAIQWRAITYSASLGIDVAAALVALACLLAAAGVMKSNLGLIAKRSVSGTLAQDPFPSTGFLTVPLVFTAVLALGSAAFDASQKTHAGAVVTFALILAAIQHVGGFIGCFKARHGAGKTAVAVWHVAWMSIVCGIVSGTLVTSVWGVVRYWEPANHLAFGPPLVAVSFIVSVMLLVGLMGADYPDAAREWTAKIGSMIGIATAAWVVWFGLAVYGPWVASYAVGYFQKSGVAAIAAWAITSAGGVLAGRGGGTDDAAPSAGGRAIKLLIGVAPTVFLVGYIVAIAFAVHSALPSRDAKIADEARAASTNQPTITISGPQDNRVELTVAPRETGTLERWLQPAQEFANRYPAALRLNSTNSASRSVLGGWGTGTQIDLLFVLLVATIAVAVIASRRVNINEFSLHHFYKNRLVRCYLGASNARYRKPHPLTGFDPRDDVKITDLSPVAAAPHFGPYPIINAALNLNAGSELATQERKATSFVFTPAYCGFSTKSVADAGDPRADRRPGDTLEADGYSATENYAYPHGPDVGTAVAISGAAANPNWGHSTSGPMAFLLTVFNARLGWWLGNPRWREASREPGPKFALRYLFAELLGQTTAKSPFINLSDGGHFENLGLYELVRRRCRFIIVCDAEEDRGLTFGSLGAAIRKCRADFGVEIDIDPEPIRRSVGVFGKAHCVTGRIKYPEQETAFSAGPTGGFSDRPGGASRGWLLYLKSSLTGDEPADVIEYQSKFPEFPHQSTADQFFSESQFESYRRLGYHVLRSAFAEVRGPQTIANEARASLAKGSTSIADKHLERYPLVGMFQELTRKWYAPIAVSPEAATRLADAYVVLMRRISESTSLKLLNEELVSGKAVTDPRPPGEASAEEVAAGMDLMQLVQNVYTEFGFEKAFNRANPRNSGWMSVFRTWARTPILYTRIWPKLQNNYHALFRAFVNDLLNDPEEPERP